MCQNNQEIQKPVSGFQGGWAPWPPEAFYSQPQLPLVDTKVTVVNTPAGLGRRAGKESGVWLFGFDLRDSPQEDARQNLPLLDSTAEAIHGVDLERRRTFVNPSSSKLLGYDSPEDLLGIQFRTGKLSPGLMIQGDRERLMQVFANLLSNAAKFSPEGGKVKIALVKKSGSGRVSVADQGMGIPAAFQGHLFDRFSQADSSDTRSKGGTGLGLNIAKAIVEIHSGEIGFASKPGKGATFYFELPLLFPAQAPPPTRKRGGRPGLAEDSRPAWFW